MEKQSVVFVANDNIQASKQKLEFWESRICYHKLDNSQCLHFFFFTRAHRCLSSIFLSSYLTVIGMNSLVSGLEFVLNLIFLQS